MRVTLERSNLLKALNHVHRVVERRNTIPILANVLLKSDGSTLRLKATDLDLEIVETVAAEVSRAGGTTVPAHMLYDIVRKLPEGSEVSLEAQTDGPTLSVRSGRSEFSLQMLPEVDFPDLNAGEFRVASPSPARSCATSSSGRSSPSPWRRRATTSTASTSTSSR